MKYPAQKKSSLSLLLSLFAAMILFATPSFVWAKPEIANVSAIPSAQNDTQIVILFKIINAGEADTLISVTSPEAGFSEIYSPDTLGALPVPAGDSPGLSLDGAFVTLSDIKGELADGRHIPLVLKFEKAGEIFAKAIYQAAKKTSSAANATDHSKMDHSKMAHSMKKVGEVVDGPAPEVAILVKHLPETNGWQVSCDVTNFEFSKEQVDQAHVAGIGHAHLYVDGLKLKRIYGPIATFGALPPGEHIVRVTLNTNDHHTYSNNGKKVTATFKIIAH